MHEDVDEKGEAFASFVDIITLSSLQKVSYLVDLGHFETEWFV